MNNCANVAAGPVDYDANASAVMREYVDTLNELRRVISMYAITYTASSSSDSRGSNAALERIDMLLSKLYDFANDESCVLVLHDDGSVPPPVLHDICYPLVSCNVSMHSANAPSSNEAHLSGSGNTPTPEDIAVGHSCIDRLMRNANSPNSCLTNDEAWNLLYLFNTAYPLDCPAGNAHK